MKFKLMFVLSLLLLINLASAITWDNFAYWDFDETSGTVAEDVASSLHNGTLTGNATFSSGILGNGVLLDGDTGYVNISNTISELNDFTNSTLSVWVNTSDFIQEAGCNGGDCNIIFTGGGSGNGVYTFAIINNATANGTVQITLSDGQAGFGSNVANFSSNQISLDVWTHLVIVHSENKREFYINGVLDNTEFGNFPAIGNFTTSVIGRHPTSNINFWNGTIDELGLWNRSLDSSEITELYNSGVGITFNSGFDITLVNPSDGTSIINPFVQFNATLQPLNGNLTNATIFIWNEDGAIINQSTNIVTGSIQNTTTFNIGGLIIGNYDWNVFGCKDNSTGTSCVFAPSNFSIDNTGFVVESNIFNANTFETLNETFILNITLNTSDFIFASVNFIYNGTSTLSTESGTGNNRLYTKTLDIPTISLASELKTFFWQVTLSNSSGSSFTFNTTLETQNVSQIRFNQCDATLTDRFANFTAYDEATLASIDPFVFQATFDVWLGSGTVKKSEVIDNTTVSQMEICATPTQTFNVDATINYDSNTTGLYVARDYNIDMDEFTTSTTEIPLYLLEASDSTTFIIEVRDNTLLPVSDALVKIQRFYPGLNEFRTVQIGRTGDNGKTAGFLKTETVEYRFIVEVDGEDVLTTTKQKIIPEESPFTIVLTIGALTVSPLASFENVSLLDANLVFDSSTNLVTFTYEDLSGNLTNARLLVEQIRYDRANLVICNITSTSNPNVLSCDVSGLNGTFVAQGFIERSPETLAVAISFIVTSVIEIFGPAGLLITFFIILTAAMTAIWNPVVGILAINAAIIFVNIIGFTALSPLFIFAMIGISFILIVLIKT